MSDSGRHDFTVVSSTPIFEGKVVSLRVDDVRMPGGGTAKREIVGHGGAVSVVGARIRPTRTPPSVLLIEQYRHAVGRRLWELPAGLLDVPGEPAQPAAERELLEETGFRAERWSVLLDVATSPGFTEETVRIFLATGLTFAGRPDGEDDEEAELRVVWVPLRVAVQAALAGAIVNVMAVAGVLAADAVLRGTRPAVDTGADRRGCRCRGRALDRASGSGDAQRAAAGRVAGAVTWPRRARPACGAGSTRPSTERSAAVWAARIPAHGSVGMLRPRVTAKPARREPDLAPEPSAELTAALRGYLDHLAVERGVARNTLLSYRRDLQRYLLFLAAAGRTRIVEVTAADVSDFLVCLRTGADGRPPLAASSAARAVVAARGWHRFLFSEGTTDADPSRDVRPPTPARRLPKALAGRLGHPVAGGRRRRRTPRAARPGAAGAAVRDRRADQRGGRSGRRRHRPRTAAAPRRPL